MPSQSPDEVHTSAKETMYVCKLMFEQNPQGIYYFLLLLKKFEKNSTYLCLHHIPFIFCASEANAYLNLCLSFLVH